MTGETVCILYATVEEARAAGGGKIQPGAMWPAPWYRDRLSGYLAPYYFEHNAGERDPIVVKLPDGSEFCVDAKCSGEDHGWTVTGSPPDLTVSPSIHIQVESPPGTKRTAWHGWLKGGVLK